MTVTMGFDGAAHSAAAMWILKQIFGLNKNVFPCDFHLHGQFCLLEQEWAAFLLCPTADCYGSLMQITKLC